MKFVVGSEDQASTRDQDQRREESAMSTIAGDILELSIATGFIWSKTSGTALQPYQRPFRPAKN